MIDTLEQEQTKMSKLEAVSEWHERLETEKTPAERVVGNLIADGAKQKNFIGIDPRIAQGVITFHEIVVTGICLNPEILDKGLRHTLESGGDKELGTPDLASIPYPTFDSSGSVVPERSLILVVDADQRTKLAKLVQKAKKS